MWLNFLRGNLDRSSIPKDNYSQAVDVDRGLRAEIAERGIRLDRMWQLDLIYMCFNMVDPVLGKNRKLRQAMSLAYDVETVLDRFYNGRGIRAHSFIPPEISGFDPAYRNPYGEYDLARARRLLAEAGYPGGEGLPTFSYLTISSTDARQRGEHFAQNMAAIGVKVKVEGVTWPEYLERMQNREFEIVGASWMADYPDPENFMQLLYGPNRPPGENNASYENPEFDRLFEKASVLSDGPERLALIERMKRIVAEDAPWIFVVHRQAAVLSYDRLRNLKSHAVAESPIKYYRIREGAK
jgi:ABC-type transport system substrate-binding protein